MPQYGQLKVLSDTCKGYPGYSTVINTKTKLKGRYPTKLLKRSAPKTFIEYQLNHDIEGYEKSTDNIRQRTSKITPDKTSEEERIESSHRIATANRRIRNRINKDKYANNPQFLERTKLAILPANPTKIRKQAKKSKPKKSKPQNLQKTKKKTLTKTPKKKTTTKKPKKKTTTKKPKKKNYDSDYIAPKDIEKEYHNSERDSFSPNSSHHSTNSSHHSNSSYHTISPPPKKRRNRKKKTPSTSHPTIQPQTSPKVLPKTKQKNTRTTTKKPAQKRMKKRTARKHTGTRTYDPGEVEITSSYLSFRLRDDSSLSSSKHIDPSKKTSQISPEELLKRHKPTKHSHVLSDVEKERSVSRTPSIISHHSSQITQQSLPNFPTIKAKTQSSHRARSRRRRTKSKKRKKPDSPLQDPDIPKKKKRDK